MHHNSSGCKKGKSYKETECDKETKYNKNSVGNKYAESDRNTSVKWDTGSNDSADSYSKCDNSSDSTTGEQDN